MLSHKKKSKKKLKVPKYLLFSEEKAKKSIRKSNIIFVIGYILSCIFLLPIQQIHGSDYFSIMLGIGILVMTYMTAGNFIERRKIYKLTHGRINWTFIQEDLNREQKE